MNRNPVGWFEIYVQDMPRARNFYEAVLAIKLDKLEMPDGGLPDMEMWAFPMEMANPGASGALVRLPGVPSGGGGTLVYFSCADCAVEESRVVAAGGKIKDAKMSIGQYGFISLLIDPDGNCFGLHSMS